MGGERGDWDGKKKCGWGLWRGGGVGSTTRRWLDFWRERVGEDDVMFVNMHGNSTKKFILFLM